MCDKKDVETPKHEILMESIRALGAATDRLATVVIKLGANVPQPETSEENIDVPDLARALNVAPVQIAGCKRRIETAIEDLQTMLM